MKKEIEITDEYRKIIKAIDSGQPCTFINGKAGSGKTTLLHFMKDYYEKAKKNMVVVGPTGISALQAGGSTINSFFRFRYGVLSPSSVKVPTDKTIYKELHILFIDEASMVRADTMDAMDTFLRRARGVNKPFGGVLVVIIGDLFQLPPVVTSADKPVLEELGYVNGFYFFNAKVFTEINIWNAELSKIFRQKDIEFMTMLNKVRVAEDNHAVVSELNRLCYDPARKPHPLAITLATTNAIADEKNTAELSRIKSDPVVLNGVIEGDFKLSGANLPSPEKLVLKVGAMVMFTANGKDGDEWVNGMLGKVVKLNRIVVDVEVAEGVIYSVKHHEWKSYDYVIKAGKISQKQTGTYTQIPLTLGWAVTIHKSQGKTLNHLHIDMGNGAFATGQTYVALSRAVNIEGMTFQRPLKASDIKCCPVVKSFFDNPVVNQAAREQLSLI